MTDAQILDILKDDLMVSGNDLDDLLRNIIQMAKELITDEGITLNEVSDHRDAMLVEMYAAFLYRKRRETDFSMPRALRWALNNRHFRRSEG